MRYPLKGTMSATFPPIARRSWTILIVLAVLATACTGDSNASPATTSSSTTTSTTTPTSTSSTTVPPTTESSAPLASTDPWAIDVPGDDFDGVLLGFATGLTRAERAPRFRQIEADAGRPYDIGHVFHAWDLAIPTEDDLMHLEDGRLLMISWNGTDTKEIVAGDHDEWIRRQAEGVRDLDRRVLLRWLWEMDGNRRRAWVHSGPDYVAAWNHVRSIFAEVGATNAEWVWCPNEFLFAEGSDPEVWYPGDDEVDWLCADGYNWGTSVASPDWADFGDIFRDFHEWASEKDLPIIIGETGVGEAEPGAKADWIRTIPDRLETDLPEVDALVWFDIDFTDFGFDDFRVDTSPESYDAWLEISNDDRLNAVQR